jgi:RNA polymerase sigma-70 factor, ECF subfamily
MTRAEEQALIRRAAAGDRQAAEACVRAHQSSLYAYMLRLSGRPDVAEDVVQEAFVRALSHLDRFDPRFRFSTWLFTIARRLYVNLMQKMHPAYETDAVESSFARPCSPVSDAERVESDGHVRDALQAALLDLPVVQRETILLFHMMEWPISTIAEHLEMPEGTVKSHLHRARLRMRGLLQHHEQLGSRVREVLE